MLHKMQKDTKISAANWRCDAQPSLSVHKQGSRIEIQMQGDLKLTRLLRLLLLRLSSFCTLRVVSGVFNYITK